MLILREWDGFPSNEESLRSLLKDLFPNSKDLSVPTLANLKTIGGERKEIGSELLLPFVIFFWKKIKKSFRSISVLIQKIKSFPIFFKIRINF